MKWKVGQKLYRVIADEDGTVETWEYWVRTIRGGRVYAVLRSTHVTINTKGEWLPSYPDWCRYSWLVDPKPGRLIGEKPEDMCTTKKAAARAALRLHRVGDFEDEAMGERAGRTLKRMAA